MAFTHYTETNLGLLADWTEEQERSFLCVVPNRRVGETLIVNLEALHGDKVAFFPDWDLRPGDHELPGKALQQRRLDVLSRLKDGTLRGLVVSLRTLGSPVLEPTSLPSLTLREGQEISPRTVAQELEDLGFHRQSLVGETGDYALRGDLLDFYPEPHPLPLRISFFGDEIESIEYFHPSTQMKAEQEPEGPLRLSLQSEFALSPAQREQLAEQMRESGYNDEASILDYNPMPEAIAGWMGFWPRTTTRVENLLDHPAWAVYRPADCWEEAGEWDGEMSALPSSHPGRETHRTIRPFLESLSSCSTALFSGHPQQTPISPIDSIQNRGEPLEVSTGPTMDPQPISAFLDIVDRLCGETDRIHIHCGQQGFQERMRELLEEKLGSSHRVRNTELILEKSPWKGSFRRNGFVRISLDDFFNRTIRRGRIGPSHGQTEYLKSFEELEQGDLVVHEQFGIGRFHGLTRVSTAKQTRDCLQIEYAGDDKLYLPPDHIAWVQKYIADSGFTPTLSSLTSNQWKRVKENVQEDVEELAEELLDLYMSRDEMDSEPYPSDTLEQKQFEASFPHRETPDQQDAIREVKKDLQSPHPMDRLICGDSGFGKTEVALRAAFKVASSGRQVAMLVPTTVLARQHFETFSQRFSTFDYRIEMLSRFQTGEETRDVLEGLRNGTVDIVIGTHRLLSDDLDFSDLGLLIIDEEQRFGVEQKETLKFYRKNVDVLTLTATPIPRTLYMSLSGIQDISTINTPPEERIPIDVEVGPYRVDTAREALEREIGRGGQVFWVFNRVQTIEEVAEYVRSLVPDARVDIAHGQMPKNQLRSTMNRFYRNEIDVLVCTTIIESGLDCPSVNTMIVQNAHEFGLAQLYQLRGRVGRSHEQAHAYLFYPKTARLTEDAEARLETIKQCSELGSGFRLAMRDMEIRGAGSILGKDQHGNIRAVGFPFYCRLLQRSIRKLREGFEVPDPYPRLDFPGEHYIPEDYIPDPRQIIRQYQSLASCQTIGEVRDLAERWEDTFGPIPEPTRSVLRRHIFKIMIHDQNWSDVRYKNQRLNLKFSEQPPRRLVESAREVGCEPRIRQNRLFIPGLDATRLQEWLRRVTEEAMVDSPVPV